MSPRMTLGMVPKRTGQPPLTILCTIFPESRPTGGVRMGPQRRAWRIFNRPSPTVPEIRILGPPERERRRVL